MTTTLMLSYSSGSTIGQSCASSMQVWSKNTEDCNHIMTFIFAVRLSFDAVVYDASARIMKEEHTVHQRRKLCIEIERSFSTCAFKGKTEQPSIASTIGKGKGTLQAFWFVRLWLLRTNDGSRSLGLLTGNCVTN